MGAAAETSATSRAAQRVGLVLKGRWRLDALIGVGGMAAVYSATHRNGSRVAIKLLNPEFAAQPDFVARFMREGYVANMIEHPASVRVIDDDVEDGMAFLVMELLSGHSLERYARHKTAQLPPSQLFHVADQVLDLLAIAHGHGILHRDIKPANIHLTATGQVKVLDFGIARLAERIGDVSATQTGAALGTPAYMPPEQARGRWNQVDPRTDLWALGATMYALVVGDCPRRAETVQEEMLLAMTAPLPPLREVAPQAPAGLIDLIERATAFEMDARWPDARSMQQALRQLVDGMNLSPTLAMAPPPVPGPVLDGPGPTTGSGASGPRVDTGRMVFGGVAQPERDPSTLQAMESSAGPPAKSRLGMAITVFVVTLVGGIAVGAKLLLPPAAPVTAAAPLAAPPPLPAPPPSIAPSAPAAQAAPTSSDPSMELPATPAPAVESPPASSAETTVTTTTTTLSRHHHARPADSAGSAPASSGNPFDQRF